MSGSKRRAAEPHRWLPPSWRGDGREAHWRRSRARRLLAGVLGVCAVLAVVGAVRPSAPPTHTITVAARDLPAGAHLHAGDLRQVQWSTGDRVAGVLAQESATGKVLIAPIRSGEPVTSTRVRGPRTWPSVPTGRVVVAVTAADAGIVQVLQPGDRVDLIDTGKSRTVAFAVPVIAIPSSARSDESPAGAKQWSASQAPTVLVAVTTAQATAVGSASAARSGGLGGGIQLALRANP